MKIKCPCCGKETIEEKFDICPLCLWENDPVQSKFVGFEGGANKVCLAVARENYRNYGISDITLKK